jgi:hypothetical protein
MENKEDEKGKEATLLQELCGADAELYECLSTCLYLNPLAAVSPRDLTSLTKEAEKGGKFRPALDKAILEGAQNPLEREKYIRAIRDLASKSVQAAEQEREAALREGRADLAESLGRAIKDQQLMCEKAEVVLGVASKFYAETLLTLGEDARRENRLQARRAADGEEMRVGQRERSAQEARKHARKGMGRREKKEAEKEGRREELAARERKETRAEERRATEGEEKQIAELEKGEREARTEERRGK